MKLIFFFIFFIFATAFGQQVINTLTTKDLTVNGPLKVNSTTKGSKPCPTMTQTQRNAIVTPASGECVYNSTTNTLNAFNGSVWGSIGGGLSAWTSSYVYQSGDVVIDSNKIYKALSNHTSGVFATDLAAGKWIELSAGVTDHTQLSNIGTNTHAQIDSAIANSVSHIANTSNPHATTKAQVGLSNVLNVDTTTTANIADSTNKRFVTDANLSTIGNQSGINTGDLTTQSLTDGAAVTVSKIELPNSQITNTGTDTRVIETGNTNLLVNPSFEHSTVTTGWTLTNATAAQTLTDFTDGKKGLTVTPTIAGGGIKQVSTLYAAKIIGGQGVAKVSVKTTGIDVKVCPLLNGSRPTDVTKYCATVPASTSSVVFPEAIIPFILDGTSNGIEIYSTGTSVFTIDEAFVGKSIPFQNVTSESVFSAKVSSAGVVSEESADFISGNCVVTATSTYTCSFNTSFFTVSPNCSAISNVNATVVTAQTKLVSSSSFQYIISTTNTTAPFAEGATVICQKQGKDIPLASKIYSQSSQDVSSDIITWAHKTTAMTGSDAIGTFNTYSYSISSNSSTICASAPTQAAASMNANGIQLFTRAFNTASTCASPSRVVVQLDKNLKNINRYFYSSPGKVGAGNIESAGLVAGNTWVGVQNYAYDQTTGLLTIDVGYNETGAITTNVLRFFDQSIGTNAYFVFNGTKYADVVGSFAGLEKCANDYECTDTFSAQISSAGVVSNENLDWISGNCTNANPTVCTLNSNLKDGTSALSSAMNCTLTLQSTGSTAGMVTTNTTSSIAITMYDTVPRGTLSLAPFVLKCQKGANDYKPKTAKIASSIGVPTVPGVVNTGTGNAIDTFSFSFAQSGAGTTSPTVCSVSPCQIDQIGNAVVSPNGVVRSAQGVYVANFTKTYISLKCSMTLAAGNTQNQLTNFTSCKGCNSLTISAGTPGVNNFDSAPTLYCQGSY